MVSFELPPGSYTATVDAGCADTYQIQHAGGASIDVPAGQTVTGALQVAAVRRIAVTRTTTYRRVDPPVPPGAKGSDGTWHVGQTYAVMFGAVDRCTGTPATSASLQGTLFVPGRGYQLVGPPPASTDDTGHGSIGLTCTTAGADPQLIARSTIDDRDAIDLLGFDSLDRPVPTCEQ